MIDLHLTRIVPEDPYEAFRWAEKLFADRDYVGAARILEDLLSQPPSMTGLLAARELLARSYFHSAQLRRAEETARVILGDHPDNSYAALLLLRALERQGRHDEAASARRLAEALGALES